MEKVEKIILGKTNLLISRVVYGGIISMGETQMDSDAYVSYAIDSGVNYFDVAPTYGDAQLKLGNSLKPYRKNVFLACKSHHRGAEGVKASLLESMELLHTDYFDVFQMHSLTTPEDIEQAFADDGAVNYLIKAKKEGIIRNFGFSAHNEEVGIKALSLYDFDTLLFPFNWAVGNKKGMGDAIIKKAKEKNMGILALKSLAMRHWMEGEERSSPKCWYKPVEIPGELATAALKYTLSQGVHTIVPPGDFSYFKFAVENINDCIKNPLTESDKELFKKELLKLQADVIF